MLKTYTLILLLKLTITLSITFSIVYKSKMQHFNYFFGENNIIYARLVCKASDDSSFSKTKSDRTKNASHHEPFAQNSDPNQILSLNVEMGYLALRLRF